ncbi:hypothetical protein CDEF62S_00953 [Castellaniella defragrans]
MKQEIMAFFREEDGVTAIEYGMIAAVIVSAILLAFTSLGTGLQTLFSNIVSKLTTQAGT